MINLKSLLIESLEEGDKVKVNKPGYKYHGKNGTVIDISPQGSFYTVNFGKDESAYFHESDLKLVRRPSI